MKINFVVAALATVCLVSTAALAQTKPSSNATSLGDGTTTGGSAGMPNASNPAGQIATTSTGPGAPPAPTSTPAAGTSGMPTARAGGTSAASK